METWKSIPDSEFYSVSDQGNIRNDKTGYIFQLKNKQKHDRYATVVIGPKENRIRRKVHRLVAQMFIPNPENKPEINHIDGNKFNNRVDNLEWCTHSENMKHAIRENLYPPPSHKRGVALFNEDETECLGYYDSIIEASKETGVPINTIYCTLCQRNRKPVNGFVWLKEGRDIRLTTSENKVDIKESTGNE